MNKMHTIRIQYALIAAHPKIDRDSLYSITLNDWILFIHCLAIGVAVCQSHIFECDKIYTFYFYWHFDLVFLHSFIQHWNSVPRRLHRVTMRVRDTFYDIVFWFKFIFKMRNYCISISELLFKYRLTKPGRSRIFGETAQSTSIRWLLLAGTFRIYLKNCLTLKTFAFFSLDCMMNGRELFTWVKRHGGRSSRSIHKITVNDATRKFIRNKICKLSYFILNGSCIMRLHRRRLRLRFSVRGHLFALCITLFTA